LSYKVFRGFNQILGCEFLKDDEFACLNLYLVHGRCSGVEEKCSRSFDENHNWEELVVACLEAESILP
jgi:hypothetical protein